MTADLIIVDEFSMVDMWLAKQLFQRLKDDCRIVLVGDADQLPSVGAGNVFHELIECGLIPVTMLDEIFRQAKDSLIAHNAKFINDGSTNLYYGPDFVFYTCNNQNEAAEKSWSVIAMKLQKAGLSGYRYYRLSERRALHRRNSSMR